MDLVGRTKFWRYALLVTTVLGSLGLVLALEPFAQSLAYHDFADRRTFLGIPNFVDVTTNLPFLLVGLAGLSLCYRRSAVRHLTWSVFFGGVALGSVGSAYYHWSPSNDTLVWDRLPMTLAFMGMFVALLSEFLNPKLERPLLLPALLVGLSSVLYWRVFGDLRLYAWVQAIPLLTIPVVMTLFTARYTHGWLLLLALGFYLLAKLSEVYDREVFAITQGVIAGHAVKHLLAAVSCVVVFEMLRRRRHLAALGSV